MKGKTNNPSGRPIGVPNKLTTALRQQINEFLNDNWQQVQKDFKILEPKDRLLFYDKMLSYGLPKPAPEQLEQEPEKRDVAAIMEMVYNKIHLHEQNRLIK